MNIENAKKLIQVMCHGTKAGFEIVADGKLDASDFMKVYPFALEVFQNANILAPAIAELKSLDADECEALVAEVAANLVIPSARVKAIVMAVLRFEGPVMDLIAALKMPS